MERSELRGEIKKAITFYYENLLTEYIDGVPDKPLLYTAALD